MTEPFPSTPPCDDPAFTWMPFPGWFSLCHRCGHPAWSHPQADPLADIKAMRDWRLNGAQGDPPPPAMRQPGKDQQ